LLSSPGASVLSFDIIALLAVQRSGDLDEEKLRYLIKLFRPDREGNLSLLDFVKSIDSVYKELRLLRASVSNSSKVGLCCLLCIICVAAFSVFSQCLQLDRSFESIFNILFYFVAFFIVAFGLGIDPLVLFASISGFVLGFAFMIGTACSKYVEGLLRK